MSKKTKQIVIDPGHGGTSSSDRFRRGPSGEREEWINLRVSLLIQKALQTLGYEVILTREADQVVELSHRVTKAQAADLFISVHHNSSDPVDKELDFPCVFVHGSVDQESQSMNLAQIFAKEFYKERLQKCFIFSDHLIFNDGLFLLREMIESVPALITEFSFFSEPSEEKKLKMDEYCSVVALSYVRAIEVYFELNSTSGLAVKGAQASFIDQSYRARLKKLRHLIFESEEEFSATEYGLMAQDLYNQGKFELALEQLDKSLALLINSPYLKQLMELGQKIWKELKKNTTCPYESILQHGVKEVGPD